MVGNFDVEKLNVGNFDVEKLNVGDLDVDENPIFRRFQRFPVCCCRPCR
jgi:hypothetical protein